MRENNSTLRGSVEGLAVAVLICSRSWNELLTIDSQRWLGLDMKLWQWRLSRARYDRETELAKFLDYRDRGLLEFPISDLIRADLGTTSTRHPGSPFILRLQQWLMTEFRLTEAQAWDYPVGLAKMRWACHWEQEGGLNIQNAAESEFDIKIAEHLAKSKLQEGKS